MRRTIIPNDVSTRSPSRTIRVAQVLDTLQAAGKERVAVSLANGLVDWGYESHLIATRLLGPLADEVRSDVRLTCTNRRSRWDWAGIQHLCNYIDEHSIDIVHSHNPSSSYLMRVVRTICTTRFQHVVHDHHSPGIDSLKSTILDRFMLRRVDAYLTASTELTDRAINVIGLPRERVRYIPNGVEVPPVYPQPPGPPTVVHIANLHPPKDHETSVRTAALVRKKIPDLQWRLIGRSRSKEDPYFVSLCSLIDSSGLNHTVRIIGDCSDVTSPLRQAQVAILTSRYEGLPLSLLECLACGVPMVMSDVGQGPTILRDAEAGIAVPAGQPDRMADEIASLLANPNRAREMGRRGRAYIERHHTVTRMVQDVEDVYQSI